MKYQIDAPTNNTIEIPKEKAVFYMDKAGRWHNEDGPIVKRSIIRYLNQSIAKDEKGYYLSHNLGERVEKVYFRYEDTALLVLSVTISKSEITGLLNSRLKINILPENLYIRNDSLYLEQNGDVIKFSEQGLVTISVLMKEEDEKLVITHAGSTYCVPTRDR